MDEELISVIIPVYNVEKFLRYSLESVINQSYKNLEIIIVNDGSTDESKNICKEYEEKDKRVKLINQKNQGLSAARNAGLNIATGKYVGFIDSDDIISLKFYEGLYKLLKETNSDISECASVQISDENLFNGKTKFDDIDNMDFITTDSLGALNRINNEDTYIIGKSVVVWNKLYKMELFKDIRFPVGKRYEDDLTTYKLFNKIHKLVSTEKVLYNYVQRKNSIMHQEFSIKRLEAIDVYENYEKFFREYDNKYLYAKCLVKYLRILFKILNELYDSNYEEKEKIKKILNDKFVEIYDKLQNNLQGLSDKELEFITINRDNYYKQFWSMINNTK